MTLRLLPALAAGVLSLGLMSGGCADGPAAAASPAMFQSDRMKTSSAKRSW